MYGPHSMHSMARQANCQPFPRKVYPSTRNYPENKSPTVSNDCLHCGDQMLPNCNICQGSEPSRETMSKYLPEIQNPMHGSYTKCQDLETCNNSQCQPLSPLPPIARALLNNKTVTDTMTPGDHRHESPSQNPNINRNIFSCNLCSKTFLLESKLLEHKHHQHQHHHPHHQNAGNNNDKNQAELARSQFNCSICSNSNSNSITHKINPQNHARTHITPKPFTCSQCPKVFAQRTNLKNHERTHSGEKPYKCDVCHRSFSQRGNLNTHRRTHGGEKEFVCEICFKAFSQKGNLKNHARTHTGERPYHCRECGKTFGQHTDMRNHERVHTGEKPFVCTVCSKAFSQRANLKIHGRTHTGERPFECNICRKNFSQKGNLKCHLRTHYNEKTLAILS